MTLNTVIIEILKDNINQLDNEDIDIVLSLLHKRKCDKELNPTCDKCSWKGSTLCLPISRYFDVWYKNKDEEE